MRFLFVFCFLCAPLLGAFENLKTLQGDFTQEITTLEGETIVYQGKLYLKKPVHVRWDYVSPTTKHLYFDGKEAMIYEPKLEQVTIITIDDKVLDFSALLRNAKKQKDGRYRAMIEGKEYVLNVDSKELPASIEYLDEFENRVKIVFANCRSNGKIADSVFEFHPPSHVDIVRHNR